MSSSRVSMMNFLNMKGGDGEHSYANNSHFQRDAISKVQLVVEDSVKEMLVKLKFPERIKVADLGCSSGQNTFLAMSKILNTIFESYQETGRNLPEIECYLNDLPENDFNSIFKLVPFFKSEIKGRCFISGTPGSFYSRLFPNKSLHFVHSSYSIHWLSKVPQGLEDNKKSIYITSQSPLSVRKSYLDQFQNDFALFLRMRSEEMFSNGRMVLTFKGKKDLDIVGSYFWSFLSDALLDLVSEGIVKESEMDSFNLPFYGPKEGEIREAVQNEGSFEINKIETFDRFVFKTNEDPKDDDNIQSHRLKIGKNLARNARSITEPMLVAHFGDINIIEPLFNKFADHATQHYISFPHQTTLEVTVSLIRK